MERFRGLDSDKVSIDDEPKQEMRQIPQEEMRQYPMLEMLMKLKGEEGMEVAFSLEGWPEMAAETLEEIAEQYVGKDYYIFITGGVGIGKRKLGLAWMNAINKIQETSGIFTKNGNTLFRGYLSTGDNMRHGVEVGDIKIPQGFRFPEDWGKGFMPFDFRMGTKQMRIAASRLKEREPDEFETRILIFEVPPYESFDPLNPKDNTLPMTLDIGGSLIASFGGTANNFTIDVLLTRKEILEIATNIRFAEQSGDYQKAMQEGKMRLQKDVPVEILLYNQADPILVWKWYEGANVNMAFLGEKTLKTGYGEFTVEDLRDNEKLRLEAEENKIRYTLTRWGIDASKYNIWTPDVLRDRVITDLTEVDQKFKFPFDRFDHRPRVIDFNDLLKNKHRKR